VGSEERDRIDARLVDYYSARGAEYEHIYEKPERRNDLVRLKRLVESLVIDEDVLELACGTGYWTERVARVARSVVATDARDRVLEVARSKRLPPERVRFAVLDAFDVSAIPGRFTAAVAGFWWSHVRRERVLTFLGQLHARLGPRTRVIFFDNRFVPGSSTPISRTDALGNSYQRRVLADGREYEVLKNFPTPDELRQALVPRAEDVAVVELEYHWLLSYRVGGLHA
jgi:SAM-dependent methyltransferase